MVIPDRRGAIALTLARLSPHAITAYRSKVVANNERLIDLLTMDRPTEAATPIGPRRDRKSSLKQS